MKAPCRLLRPCVIFAAFGWVSANCLAEDDDLRLATAQQFVESHRVYQGDAERPTDYQAVHQGIAATADPDTKFGYVVFSVSRHRAKLLSDVQAAQIDALIEARKHSVVKWHDVRNIVRVHAVLAMWDYAEASANHSEELARLREDWEAWTDLVLAYMFEEFVAQERFQRAMWEVYTPVQRASIVSGEWDSYLKKSTGHGRLFSADKQVRRVLGDADDPAAFEKAATTWRERWEPMLEQYRSASRFQRQREFAMDDADETFAVASWSEYVVAFRAFVTAECEAIRDVLQSGYEIDAELIGRLDQHREKLRADMVEKYRSSAADFLDALGAAE